MGLINGHLDDTGTEGFISPITGNYLSREQGAETFGGLFEDLKTVQAFYVEISALETKRRKVSEWSAYSNSVRIPFPASAPPKSVSFFLSLVLPRATQEETIGDLEEMFARQVAKYGLRRAQFWLWCQVFIEIGSSLIRRFQWLAAFGAIYNFVRRMMG